MQKTQKVTLFTSVLIIASYAAAAAEDGADVMPAPEVEIVPNGKSILREYQEDTGTLDPVQEVFYGAQQEQTRQAAMMATIVDPEKEKPLPLAWGLRPLQKDLLLIPATGQKTGEDPPAIVFKRPFQQGPVVANVVPVDGQEKQSQTAHEVEQNEVKLLPDADEEDKKALDMIVVQKEGEGMAS